MSAILAVAAASKVGKDVTSLLIKQMFTETMTTETIQMLLEDPNALIGAFDSPAVVRKFFSSTAFQTAFFLQPAAYRVRAISKLIGVEAVGPYDNMNQVGGDYRAIAAMVGLKPADYTSWSNMVADPAALSAILGVSPTLVTFSTLAMNVITASASAVTQLAQTTEGRTLLLTNPALVAGIQANPASLAALDAVLLEINAATDWSTWMTNTALFDEVLADTARFTGLMVSSQFMTALAQNAVAASKVCASSKVRNWLWRDVPAMNIFASYTVACSAVTSSTAAMSDITDMALGKLLTSFMGQKYLTPDEVTSLTAIFADSVLRSLLIASPAGVAAFLASPVALRIASNSPAWLTTLQTNSTAWAGFQANTVLPKFVNPVMTNSTTPSGYIASASYFYNNTYPAWLAFDNNFSSGSGWWAPNNSTAWIQLICPVAVLPVRITLNNQDGSYYPTLFSFSGSIDGVNWTELVRSPFSYSTSVQIFNVPASTKYQVFRLASISGTGWSLLDFRIEGFL